MRPRIGYQAVRLALDIEVVELIQMKQRGTLCEGRVDVNAQIWWGKASRHK